MSKKSFILMTVIFSIIVSILSWIMWGNNSFKYNGSILFLVVILINLVIIIDTVFQKFLEKEGIEHLRKIIIIAFIFRIIYIILFYIIAQIKDFSNFAVYDDEFYYLSYLSFQKGNLKYNYYNYFLKFIYDIFGNYGVSGRLINIFILIVILYPMAYLETYLISKSKKLNGTFLFSVMPFIVFWSFFEIKDIITMMLYIMFLFICSIRKDRRISNTMASILVIFISFIIEGFRGNIGIILIFMYIISFLTKEGNNTRNVLKIIIISVILIIFYTKMATALASITNQVDKYQLWIYTQFGNNSYRKAFLVTSIKDVWKLPFGIILYLMSPIIGFYDTGRFMLDFGGFLKFFEQVIILLGILGLPKLFDKSKWLFAAMMIPLIFVASTNNSNYRQGIFIFPIVYLSASLFDNCYLKDRQYKNIIIWILLISCIFMNSILLYLKA